MNTEKRPPRVLVVDDDAGVLRAVARVLGKRHRIITAETGTEALEAAARERPDVAIIDVRLPDICGFDVTRALKRSLKDVDAILMTGNAEDPDDNLVRAIDEGAFFFIQKPFDRRVLLALVDRCFELRRLRGEREEYLNRVRRELEHARLFQESMLPPPRFQAAGTAIAAFNRACHELTGDFYDYLETGEGNVALLIADVVGHGVSAALMTGLIKAAFRSAQAEGFEPRSVIDRVRDGLRGFDGSRFVTLCCGRFDPRAGVLEYVNAGHPAPLARIAGAGSVQLKETGPLMSSAMSHLPFATQTLRLATGDAVLFYTDGVVDARGPTGFYGPERLGALFSSGASRGPDLIDRIVADVAQFSAGTPSLDDFTMLVLERT